MNSRACARLLSFVCAAVLMKAGMALSQPGAQVGYYRDPAVHADTVVFTAEGDL